MQTLNSSSYSCTIFCWKASGRGCCVRGDLSMYGRVPEGRGHVWFVWSRSSGLARLDCSAQPVVGLAGRSRVLGHARPTAMERFCDWAWDRIGCVGSRWALRMQVFVCRRCVHPVYSDPLWRVACTLPRLSRRMGEIAIFGLETSYLGTWVPSQGTVVPKKKKQAWLRKYLPGPDGTEQ